MLNDRIKEARIKAGLTQKQLAEKVGIATTTLSGYERGASDPDINTLCKIMDVVGVDANFIYQDYNKEDTKKSPAPEGTEEERFTVDDMKFLLNYLGYGDNIEDISDKDYAFLSGIFDLLEAWFG